MCERLKYDHHTSNKQKSKYSTVILQKYQATPCGNEQAETKSETKKKTKVKKVSNVLPKLHCHKC